MLYRSLIIVLLAVASLYAQSELSKSRFIVQADLNYTKLYGRINISRTAIGLLVKMTVL